MLVKCKFSSSSINIKNFVKVEISSTQKYQNNQSNHKNIDRGKKHVFFFLDNIKKFDKLMCSLIEIGAVTEMCLIFNIQF